MSMQIAARATVPNVIFAWKPTSIHDMTGFHTSSVFRQRLWLWLPLTQAQETHTRTQRNFCVFTTAQNLQTSGSMFIQQFSE